MKLWDSVKETDPAFTKKVAQRGGYTTVCAMHRFENATKLWGAYGGKWGLNDITYQYVVDGQKVVEVSAIGQFYYPDGKFQIMSDIAYRAGGDCLKKLQTDMTTKSLSKLGFNADIYLGKFDDDKYVNGIKAKKEQKNTAKREWQAICMGDKDVAKKFKELKMKLDDGDKLWASLDDDAPLSKDEQFIAAINEKHEESK